MNQPNTGVQFHPLTVAEIAKLTDEAVAVSFTIPAELSDAFTHTPGQHVVIRADLDGEDVRRSYSICSLPGEPELTVGIKRIPNGLFSTYATTQLGVGDTVEVMAPIGEFAKAPKLDQTQNQTGSYVAIAAGSGITPILSMIATTLEHEPGSRFTLLYGNRSAASIMFLERFEDLKNRFADRLQIVHVLSREPHQVPLFQGRIDADKLRSLATTLIDAPTVDGWYLCGPLEMVETITETLAELGVANDRVHHELFFDERIETLPGQNPLLKPGEHASESLPVYVTIDGRTSSVEVAIAPNSPSLLDYARSVRAEVPFACKGGMCATCKARVVRGEVTMTKNYALTDAEIDAGFVLTCQANPTLNPDGTPTSDEIEISYDTHGGIGR